MCCLVRNRFFHAVTQVGSCDLFRQLFKFSRSQRQSDSFEVDMEVSVLAFLDGKIEFCPSGDFFYLHVPGRFHR